MQRAGEIIQDVESILFVVLGIVAIVRWCLRRGRADAWLAAMFGTLAAVVIAGRLLPDEPAPSQEAWVDAATKALVIVLVAFPYFAFRFGETFGAAPRPWRRAASLLTVATIGTVFLIGAFPEPGEPRPPPVAAWVVLFLIHWVALSSFTMVRLFLGGRGQPTVARRRMRLMATGFGLLAVVLLISGTAPTDPEDLTIRDLVTRSLGLIASPALLIGFAPPPFLVWLWRRKEDAALQEAETSLLRAYTPEEIGQALLPHAARLVGARSAVLRDRLDRILATYGGDDSSSLPGTQGDPAVRSFAGEHATLHISVGVFAPFFGREELRILQRLTAITDLALARSTLLQEQARNLEMLAASNETLRDFVAIASHDLRTPLTVIRGLIEMLDEHWARFDDETKAKQIAAIRRQSGHLSSLVEDLLTVSKLDAGALEPDPVPIDLGEAISTVVRDLAIEGDEVQVRIPAGLTVRADPEHLTRIVANYLQNARTYGAPPVEVTASARNGAVEIRVRDHGPGIAPEFRQRMFEKFARADKRMSKGSGGTGLGLAIVRGLARAGGGDAWFEEERGGACFVVSLPTGGDGDDRP